MFLASAYLAGIAFSAVELRHLRYFVAVAEMENVSRAATQKLHVAQPSLSRQIRDLEDEVGVQLLERTAKSVRLTAPGRIFLEEARAILKCTAEALLRARAIGGKSETELHIGYSPTPTAEILPKILRAFQRMMPNVRAKLHDLSNNDIFDGIRDGRLQLGLTVPPLNASALRDVRFEELFHQPVCVAVAPQHPFTQRRAIPIAEVAAEPLIGLTRKDYPEHYDYLSIIFSKVKQKPWVVEEHDSYSGIMSAVAAGKGVTITIGFISESFGGRVKLLRLTPEPKPVSVGIFGTKRHLNPAAEQFWQCAKEACGAFR
jgi:LysR family transcriptional regulator, benzoate and cis,cis-muconate-responsive activator of ben and cat genes